MSGKYLKLIALFVLAVIGTACNQKLTTTQMQHARMDETKAAPRTHLSYMVDNAIMQDMTLADFHFVPHTAELSGTGIMRLDRMAVVLDTYGGTVRLDTLLTDEDMIASRMKHVHDYLDTTGCDMSRVKIETALAGGRGMPAQDAIEGKEKAAQASTSGTAAGPAVMALPTAQ